MRAVHDSVNNALNNLQWFRMETEGGLPADSLRAFDEVIQRTSAELTALGDLTSTPEKSAGVDILIG